MRFPGLGIYTLSGQNTGSVWNRALCPEFVALVSEILGEEPERADRPQ
jgi:hypothetical protein